MRQASITAPKPANGLYLVSTPIGNLGDISLRALETLAGCDLIACEDTRTSGVLLSRYGIQTPKISYNEHNAPARGQELLNRLEQGQSVSVISDAGTPLISDPGFRLVQSTIEAGIAIIPVPGASAPIAALVASGLPNEQFLFAGFLPSKQGARQKRLSEFSNFNATLIFFESPKRLAASLADMVKIYGNDRPAAVGREITKMHETFYRGTLAELADTFATDKPPKGEIVVLIEGKTTAGFDEDTVDQMLLELLSDMPTGKAAAKAAEITGQSKRDLYQRALALKDANGK